MVLDPGHARRQQGRAMRASDDDDPCSCSRRGAVGHSLASQIWSRSVPARVPAGRGSIMHRPAACARASAEARGQHDNGVVDHDRRPCRSARPAGPGLEDEQARSTTARHWVALSTNTQTRSQHTARMGLAVCLPNIRVRAGGMSEARRHRRAGRLARFAQCRSGTERSSLMRSAGLKEDGDTGAPSSSTRKVDARTSSTGTSRRQFVVDDGEDGSGKLGISSGEPPNRCDRRREMEISMATQRCPAAERWDCGCRSVPRRAARGERQTDIFQRGCTSIKQSCWTSPLRRCRSAVPADARLGAQIGRRNGEIHLASFAGRRSPWRNSRPPEFPFPIFLIASNLIWRLSHQSPKICRSFPLQISPPMRRRTNSRRALSKRPSKTRASIGTRWSPW